MPEFRGLVVPSYFHFMSLSSSQIFPNLSENVLEELSTARPSIRLDTYTIFYFLKVKQKYINGYSIENEIHKKHFNNCCY